MAKKIGKKQALRNVFRQIWNGLLEAEESALAGPDKKAKVKAALKRAAKAVDVPFIPDWIERIITNTIIDALIDTLASILNDCGLWPEVDPVDYEQP